ncbi:MAG: SatD family protein [Opitutus sp.]
MQVIAVIGDIVGSRTVTQRAAFQKRLVKALEHATRSARHLASPYTITLGDEFQAVYRKADGVFANAVAIMAEIYPVRTRFSFGVGELSTRINPTQALGMDGPSFHDARAALTALKDDERLIRIGGRPAAGWGLANHVLNLLSHELNGWSRNRLLILAGLLRGESVKDIEAGLQISRVAVYKNIRAAALDEVVGICQQLEAAMNQALRNP